MTRPAPILLTGFEPFGGEPVNPSARIAQALDGALVDGVPIASRILPCTFAASLRELDAALHAHAPQIVLCLGQAAGRDGLSLERIAINVIDARIADNAGAQPIDEPVIGDGPAAYWSTLPIKAISAGLRAAGIPCGVSQSAGTFVCNHVFYGLMHRLAANPAVRGGFMHVPLMPEQAARNPGHASMPLETMIEGVRHALALTLRHTTDLRTTGGAIA